MFEEIVGSVLDWSEVVIPLIRKHFVKSVSE